MKNGIKISDDFSVPPAIATLTSAILGVRGSGKTNTGVVIVEGLLSLKQQVVVVDPQDGWHGLRSSADGRAAGFPVTVLGGYHGDLPLTAQAGALVADLVVDNPSVSIVLSLRKFESQADMRRFVTDFARRLFHRKGEPGNNTPLLVVIDEASLFVPQRVGGAEAQMVGAIQKLVRQGRTSGLGVCLIDQRAASINKDVLTQIELLVAHRHTSPQDRKALEQWVEANDTGDRSEEFMASLASLPPGTAWFWSPGWLDIFHRVSVNLRKTFDSSATPKAGDKVITPKVLAPVDLEKLKAAMAATIEKAEADDPAKLKKKIAELQAQLKKPVMDAKSTIDSAEIIRTLRDRVLALEDEVSDVQEITSRVIRGDLAEPVAAAAVALTKVQEMLGLPIKFKLPGGAGFRIAKTQTAPAPKPKSSFFDTTLGVPYKQPAPARPSPRPTRSLGVAPFHIRDSVIGGGERRVLTAVAQYPDGVDREQVSILTGYKRSTRDAYLQRLRTAGHIDDSNEKIVATPDGLAALGDFQPLPTGNALQAYWLAKLPEGERRVLACLLAVHPTPVLRDTVTEVTGYKRSTRDAYLQRLTTRKLVKSGNSGVSVSEELFD